MPEGDGSVPVFETDRLLLRPFRSDDAEAAFAVYGDPEVMRYSISGPFDSVEGTATHIGRHIGAEAEDGRAFRAIVERQTGMLIGVGGLVTMPPPWDAVEVGYRIRRDHWGRGYATEATIAWLDAGFRYLRLDRILAVVEAANVASLRVLEKRGMRAEGEAVYLDVPVLKFAAHHADWSPQGDAGTDK